ncbi:hypothetical protein [Anaerospora sp.]|uniref:hypothetical protein n=1 Tax=Anaerospora sp. TaxID=1960278 RepID=UPI00289AB2FC|nr:hypothetical protein [Anaerospora sp.]
MGGETVEREILDRLTRIEARQDLQLSQCQPCRTKVDNHEVAVAKLDAAAKSAHYRLDMMQAASVDLRKDLSEAIKEQINGIYRTAALIGGVAGFFVGIIMMLIKH